MRADTRSKMARARGERLSPGDAERLRAKFRHPAVESLIALEVELPLAGATLTLSEERDPSGIGVEMEWMVTRFVFSEAEEATPGIQAARLGLVPVGMC